MPKKIIHRGDGGGVEALPPAGDEQRDILRERADALAEAGETALPEIERARPDAFRVENELAQHFDALAVSNPDPMYVYAWVQCISQHGYFVKSKAAQGWEVVQGDMPEAAELRGMGADTTRKLGDVVLMRCRRDVHKRLQRHEDRKRESMQAASTARLQELGMKLRGMGVKVGEFSEFDARTADLAMKRAQAQAIAQERFTDHIRQGTVPGARVVGAGR